ncbi:aminopeptidase N [Asanoa sp. WMMD1127]|uniref:aminopeptidase N n=1 Tax=Asanoa sp. WMMD1127 TaxID=3016107 RepID=UPI0024176211|nr:aminopeptidase N [Asanoa sp. WMMD1127]MDG4827634.1 aminopeptidase N [Asanoa sp. WMMD1127]
MRSLTQQEATDRAAAITVEAYTIDLDVTTDDHFRSTTTIRFRAAEPGSATFVELKPVRLHAATLNGAALDPAALDGNRLALTGLRADNELTVEADMAYSNTSEGLHRFVDPADGGVYLHATSFLDEAQRIFACFDQPDLKAPVTMRVTAPAAWTVAANAAVASRSPAGATNRWEFVTTPPLATYFVTVIAGPYHVVESTHDGLPLALFCKASVAEHLDKDADEIFTITRQCLDRFHELFGFRYPFGKYDQAFVPEFNAGAMENPGLVVIRDEYVYRSAVTDNERELRATTIAHEMAHMWFGDLVTMRWWDDLWLNESFAEYMGTRVTAEATRFRNAWTTFGMRRKGWGYETDQRPSTHPVAPTSVPDSADALVNFDGISYAKGAAALRQLVAWVGDEAFLAGIRAHFQTHAFGNATLADLLGALSTASGRDLSAWAARWLREPGVNTLRVEAPAAIVQSGAVLRPHRVAFGLYDRAADGATTLRRRIEVDVDGERTEVPQLRDEPAPDLLLLNDGDLTFAKIRLDPASAAAVPAVLPGLRDPLSRAVLWTSTIDAVRDAERPVSDLVDLLVAALPAETEVIVVVDALLQARNLIDRYLAPGDRAAALARVASVCEVLVADPDAGASRRLAAMRALVDAGVDASRLLGWLDGVDVPAGVEVDEELRWRIVHRLAVLGAVDADRIAAELAADRSAAGEEWAARARAARPDPEAKAAAWAAVIDDDTLSNRLLDACARGLFQPEQTELTAPYVERYFAEMPAAARRRTPYAAEHLADLAFPRYAVEQRTRDLAAAMLARDDLPAVLRRVVIDNDDDLRLALAARGR